MQHVVRIGKSQWAALYSVNGKKIKFIDSITKYNNSEEEWDSGMLNHLMLFFTKKSITFFMEEEPYDDAIGLKISDNFNFQNIFKKEFCNNMILMTCKFYQFKWVCLM